MFGQKKKLKHMNKHFSATPILPAALLPQWEQPESPQLQPQPILILNFLKEADSAQRQETNEEMNLEDFLIMSGVVWCGAHYRSPSLQHSCVQNNNNTVLGSGTPGCLVRPVIASRGGGILPAYQPLQERSVQDAASAAVARKPSGYQPLEVGYGGKMQNNSGEGGFRQGSPASPLSSGCVGANQSGSVNNLDMDINVADRSIGQASKVVLRKQCCMIKNRESDARSRARRQAYTRDLEARLHVLKEENASLQQDMVCKTPATTFFL